MEIRDLYNVNKEITSEVIEDGGLIPSNRYILIVVIFIENDKHQFLIQKRSALKGGLWATTGGHPKSGESSLEGILTEVKEELGIDILNPTLFNSFHDEDAFCDLYYLNSNIDINDVKMDSDEVSAVKWATRKEINELYNSGLFKKSHYNMYLDCLKFLDK